LTKASEYIPELDRKYEEDKWVEDKNEGDNVGMEEMVEYMGLIINPKIYQRVK
jgi:hypothetical protein